MQRGLRRGPPGFSKKLLSGLEKTYKAIQAERKEEEDKRERRRLEQLDPDAWKEEVEGSLRNRRKKGHTQPVEVSWHEFLRHMRWTPATVDDLADDFVYVEWGIYSLKIKYGIPIE